MTEPTPPRSRDAYGYWLDLPTRWMDNDVYGHVNNVQYYSFVDTVVNHFLINEGGLDIHEGDVIGIAAESGCRFFASLTYPDVAALGLRIAHLGNSSVRYEVGIFAPGADLEAAAAYFVHVFVDRESRRPTRIPETLRQAMGRLA